jgi:hypothetical protein
MNTTGTVVTSRTIDTTRNRRDLPPLNVYVRIRPFIGDELERNENQKLLDILNEKHIAVKIHPTINNAVRTVQASYNEYEVLTIDMSSSLFLTCALCTLYIDEYVIDSFVGNSNIRSSLYTTRIIRTNS